MTQISYHIHITGIVQGVGFRPFIFNLALEHSLLGCVRNSASGVDIEVVGDPENIESFIAKIPSHAPPLAQIDPIKSEKIETKTYSNFRIIPSKNKQSDFIPVSPEKNQ